MSILRSAAKLGFVSWDAFLRSPSGPRILIYHQVGADSNLQMNVKLKDFEWQLDWLAENRKIVDLDTAVRHWGSRDSDRLVVVTFDDGFLHLYQTAFPMLRVRDMPFTVYLATEMVEKASVSPGGDDALTWDMVNEMLKSGLAEIGAHTHTHPDLRIIDRDATAFELTTSDHLIRERTGVTPRHFAYPWGYWSPQADSLVRERYETAVLGASFRSGPVVPPRHRIHRFPVQLSDGRMFFERRLRGGLLAEELVRRRLRGYRGP